VVGVTVVVVVAVAVFALVRSRGDGDDAATTTGSTTTLASTTSTASTTTSITTVVTTTTTATTTTAATPTAPPVVTPAPPPPTPPPAVPGGVTDVRAGPGGGSGEIVAGWDAVTGATGYRVLRSATPDGPFEVAAAIDVTTGRATSAAGVVNVWSQQHSYVPPTGTLSGPDTSPWFEYVEYGSAPQRCFKVVAVDAAGEGPASPVACGSPP
jgi:hypothetical protein